LTAVEQIPGENFVPKERVKLYVVEVKKSSKGPQVIISRAHSGLVKKLFEMEVPEIKDGTLEIKAIAREPGRRTKIAILSHDDKVGAVGTCIGHMGARIQNIVKELGQERVDVIEWKEDSQAFITAALGPAKVASIEINEADKAAKVFVPEKELSLAIGKEGQNVRLAVKLTGWKLDILSEGERGQVKAREEEGEEEKSDEKGA
jgi:N utilization substance protein A